MKKFAVALLMSSIAGTAISDPLSNADRETILEQLETVGEETTAKVDARFRTAISDYRSAMASGDATLDLYLNCEEKVSFEEMKRPNSEFRDWKRNNAGKFSDKHFREALRQQLRWLVLTLEAASEDADRDRLSMEASKTIESIVIAAEELTTHRNLLGQGVTSTVFARAYRIDSIKVEKWPLSPVPIAAAYELAILPPLRRSDRTDSLRTAWSKRFIQEAALVEAWSGEEKKGTSGDRSAAYDKFVSESLPQLRWDAETDLFRTGDEKVAAANMLKHIRENTAHAAAPGWIADLTELLRSPEEK